MEAVAEVFEARQRVLSLPLGKKRQSWLERIFFPPPDATASSRGRSIALIFVLLSLAYYIYRRKKNKELREREKQRERQRIKDREAGVPEWDYAKLKELVRDVKLPAMFVEQNIMNRNIVRMAEVAAANGKTIRLATKSVRVPAIIEHILEIGNGVYKGLMCYCVHEAHFLSQTVPRAKDYLIAYPAVQSVEFELVWEMVVKNDNKVALMIDCIEHVRMLDEFWSNKIREARSDDETAGEFPKCSVCIDVDMSYRPFGDLIHLGVHRSPVRSLETLKEVINAVRESSSLRLSGIMGYDAQIAGLPDDNPNHSTPMKMIIRTIKHLSSKDVPKKRREISDYLKSQGIELDFFNGGGTGSLEASCKEEWLTEVTIGSGVLQSSLFDYYRENSNIPGFCFGLRITRVAEDRAVVCQSGGFVASGDGSLASLPTVFLPEGLKPFSNEGFGEVQTPLSVPKQLWNSSACPIIGDPVFLRPAKAGEIAERFEEYCIVDLKQNQIVNRVKTYRGHGLTCF